MAHGDHSVLKYAFVAATIVLSGCSSGPRYSSPLYTAPIPLGYTKKDDLINKVRPDLKKSLQEVNEGVKIDTKNLIRDSETKVSPKGVRTSIPWKTLEGIFQ